MIPRRLVRTVPTDTTVEVEAFWAHAVELHPGWEHVTLRDPIDPGAFPLTSPHWATCTSGAQRAGLIRLEELFWRGGIYLDSDVELYRPLDSLLPVYGFAAWEDANCIPDAVLGFEPMAPVVKDMLDEAVTRLADGAWESGPGVTTRNLAGEADVLLLPPGAFFPYHYSRKRLFDPTRPQGAHARTRLPREQPWAFGAHHWHHSWKSA